MSKKKNRMFMDDKRILITDRKGKARVVIGIINDDTVKPKTVTDIKGDSK